MVQRPFFGFDMNKNLITLNFLYEQKFNSIIMKTLHEQFIITKTLYEKLNRIIHDTKQSKQDIMISFL